MNRYSDLLKDPRWQKKRLEILNRDEFECKYCNDDENTLHVHHIKYAKGNPWDIDNKYLITLCERCHADFEESKAEFKEITNEILVKLSYDHYLEILEIVKYLLQQHKDPYSLSLLRKFTKTPTQETYNKLIEF